MCSTGLRKDNHRHHESSISPNISPLFPAQPNVTLPWFHTWVLCREKQTETEFAFSGGLHFSHVVPEQLARSSGLPVSHTHTRAQRRVSLVCPFAPVLVSRVAPKGAACTYCMFCTCIPRYSSTLRLYPLSSLEPRRGVLLSRLFLGIVGPYLLMYDLGERSTGIA